MNAQQRSRLRSVFDEAVDLPPGQRPELLDRVCRTDQELRTELDQLLEAHDASSRFLTVPEVPFAELRRDLSGVPDHSSARKTIGSCEIIRELGRGGFGTVYLAKKPVREGHLADDADYADDGPPQPPSHTLVAAKLLHSYLDGSREVLQFDREREALSALQHTNIARFVDAGVTDEGRPYFLMEFVDGVPITDFCRSREADIPARLDWFRSLCAGVAHAHQRQIVHCDLKPANVLVSARDGEITPKIIDFGVARILGANWQARTLRTSEGFSEGFVGTLQYMSPEQTWGSPSAIDTRADIYSLGAILYELLAEQPAFDPPAPGPKGLADLLALIREEDPLPPATRLQELEKAEPGWIGAHLGPRLRQTQGELEWIVAKAMEKDPANRYATVDALSEDIRRFLANEPVLAGPRTLKYQARKFIRRHQAAVFVAGVLVAAIFIALAGTLLGLYNAKLAQADAEQAALREMSQARAAEQARAIAVASEAKTKAESAKVLASQRFLFQLLAPVPSSDGRGVSMPPLPLLNFVADRADEKLVRDRPEVEAPIRAALGRAFQSQGKLVEAEHQFERAFRLAEKLFPPGHREIGSAMHNYASVLLSRQNYAEAEPLLRRSLAIYRELDHGDSAMNTPILDDLAVLLASTNRLDQAEPLLREVVRQLSIIHESNAPQVLTGLLRLAKVLEAQGKHDEAEQIRQKVRETNPGFRDETEQDEYLTLSL